MTQWDLVISLVYAFDLLIKMYIEQGYGQRGGRKRDFGT